MSSPDKPKKSTSSTKINNGSAYKGRRISRQSDGNDDGTYHHGIVDGYNSRRNVWHVVYDNGVEEELDRGELLHASELFRVGGVDNNNSKNNNDGNKNGTSYVNRRTSKKFGRNYYHGTVDSYDKNEHLWHVAYDDGDEEELEYDELLFAMDNYDRIHNTTTTTTTTAAIAVAKVKVEEPQEQEQVVEYDTRQTITNDAEVTLLEPRMEVKVAQRSTEEEEEDDETKTSPEIFSPPPIRRSLKDDDYERITSTTEIFNSSPPVNNTNRRSTVSFITTPIVMAVIAIVIWLCKTMIISDNQDFLRSTSLLKFQPDKYQGAHKTQRYFEGWYYKFVSNPPPDHNNQNPNNNNNNNNYAISSPMSMAVVPGIFYGNTSTSNESHAFVFVVINGIRQHYYRFHIDEFSYASPNEEYYIRVGNNVFTHEGVSLDLHPKEGDDAQLVLNGKLSFEKVNPWPVSLLGLGAMGPVGWMPGLECSHGILSFDHVLRGSLALTLVVDEGASSSTSPLSSSSSSSTTTTTIPFDNGRGYTEKDHGKSFPSLWIWIQSNSFPNNPGTSLFVSIARVPLFGMVGLPGFTAAVWHDEKLIPFATWSGATFEELRVSKEEVYIVMRSSGSGGWWSKVSGGSGGSSGSSGTAGGYYRVEITVDRRNVPEVLLYAPVNFTKMAPFVKEALQAKVHMRLTRVSGDGDGNDDDDVIVDDVGEYAGLEVHGDVEWLVDNVCGKETANWIICL